jgi:hypothetical protein
VRRRLLLSGVATCGAGANDGTLFARFVPLRAAQIVIGMVAIVALWPFAYEMWRKPRVIA